MSDYKTEVAYEIQRFTTEMEVILERKVKKDFEEKIKKHEDAFSTARDGLNDLSYTANSIASDVSSLEEDLDAIIGDIDDALKPFD